MSKAASRNNFPVRAAACALGIACGWLAGCGRDPGPERAKKPPEAGYVVLEQQSVPLRLTLPGRTTAYEISEVRPQVSGIVRQRLFTEGALVHEGDLLYRIDARAYESTAGEAR